MRPEFKSDIQRKVDRHGWRTVMYAFTISYIISFNIFFAIFVWNPYDKSPNTAIGFASLLMISFIIYNWRADDKDIKTEKIKFINKKG